MTVVLLKNIPFLIRDLRISLINGFPTTATWVLVKNKLWGNGGEKYQNKKRNNQIY